MPSVEVERELLQMPIADLLVAIELVASKNEAKRLISEGAVEINSERVKDWREVITIRTGDIVRIGKRKFAKLVVRG
ncbi:MAG: S4 domain-containing protein [Armatimonadota bacterium]|nr:S4 domain-containing protein [Armatimonadota bacterium]